MPSFNYLVGAGGRMLVFLLGACARAVTDPEPEARSDDTATEMQTSLRSECRSNDFFTTQFNSTLPRDRLLQPCPCIPIVVAALSARDNSSKDMT